jgi:hypothetical protein
MDAVLKCVIVPFPNMVDLMVMIHGLTRLLLGVTRDWSCSLRPCNTHGKMECRPAVVYYREGARYVIHNDAGGQPISIRSLPQRPAAEGHFLIEIMSQMSHLKSRTNSDSLG